MKLKQPVRSYIKSVSATWDGSGGRGAISIIKQQAANKFKGAVTIKESYTSNYHGHIIATQNGTLSNEDFIGWFKGIASHMKIAENGTIYE